MRLVRRGRSFKQELLMLVVVAVKTEQLPVASVGRVVVVVVVLVMDREFAELLAFEFSAAPGADMRVHLERLLPVVLFPKLPVAPGLGDEVFCLWLFY